ncbi:drug efflux system protein MdtG [Nonomuraea coxensis DSM 45129]|uniref:Drug efflux system protein MdtG n=1 Tax=Nonomuraea coxensis DSM 45129 TaxID=1122611 RepID=A0ABX8U1L7_9ACTN|nr:MFS transporter [Nonomuraea coxensis]QYC41554.1 drug efflux system protein MdtG [Nonomuraea coxensis DSM 45129]
MRRFQALPADLRISALIAFVVALGFGVIAPALPLLAAEFGVGSAVVGAAISAFAVVRLATAVVNSRFVQRFGERRVIAWGLWMQGATMIAASFAPDFTLLIALRAIGGMGSSAFTIAAMSLVLRTAPPDARGSGISTFQLGFMLGALAGPAAGGALADVNPRLPFLLYGVTLLVAAAISQLKLSPGIPPPEPRHAAGGAAPAEAGQAGSLPRGTYVRAFAAALITSFTVGWLFYGLRNSTILVFATEELGSSGTFIGLAMLGTAVTQLISVPAFGRWGDLRGRRPAMITAGVLGIVAVALLCLPPGEAVFLASMALLGVAGGGLSAAPAALLADISGNSPARNVAWFNMSSDVGAIIGPVAAGAVADALSFQAAFLITTLILVVVVVSSVAMRETLAAPSSANSPANPPSKGTPMPGPAPVPIPETLPFWEGAANGELRVQRCTSCERHYFYPRPFCPACGSADVEWTTVSGAARLLSYVINHRPLPPFDPATPVVVALVELAEGPRLMTNIVGVPPEPEHLELDMPLQVCFVERGEHTLPVFAPAGEVAR